MRIVFARWSDYWFYADEQVRLPKNYPKRERITFLINREKKDCTTKYSIYGFSIGFIAVSVASNEW